MALRSIFIRKSSRPRKLVIMAPVTKSWIFTNSTNYASNGKLFLGQVLTNPLNPETALISGKPRELPSTLHVELTRAENALINSQEALANSGGFWLKTHGVKCGVSGEAGSLGSSNVQWEVKSMVGKITTFSFDYVLSVLKEQDVTNWVSQRLSPMPPTLYIITGVRIFEGAKLADATTDQVSTVGGRVEGDGAPKAPVHGGAEVQRTSIQHTNQSFETTSDFVFAYQCNKINYFPWKRMSAYPHGQTASSETPSNNGNEQKESSSTLEWGLKSECPVKDVEFGAGGEADDVLQEKATVSSAEAENTEVKYLLA
jgi:hypothetical protein